MKKIIFATAFGLSLFGAFVSSQVVAGEALDSVNTEVEQRAALLDQKFGLLLTFEERQNLKLALIAKKVTTTEALQAGKSTKEITEAAVETYQIQDPAEQRKLMVEVDAVMSYSSGIQPPCCG